MFWKKQGVLTERVVELYHHFQEEVVTHPLAKLATLCEPLAEPPHPPPALNVDDMFDVTFDLWRGFGFGGLVLYIRHDAGELRHGTPCSLYFMNVNTSPQSRMYNNG